MELKNLQGFVLIIVLVGLLVGVGALILDKFADASKDSTTIAFGSENVTFATGVGTTANDEATSLLAVGNNTVNLTVGTEVNLSNGNLGIITTGLNFPNQSWFVSYVYDADSSASTGISAGTTAISSISSDWLALIVTIGILALILGLVMAGFVTRGGR